jgi:hypothetical protein
MQQLINVCDIGSVWLEKGKTSAEFSEREPLKH